MTSFPNSPHLFKGGIILIDPDTYVVLRIISQQYNPGTILVQVVSEKVSEQK